MVTGRDQVLISSGPIGPKIARFVNAWSVRWPSMIVEIEGAGEPRGWSAERAADLGEKASVYLVRDQEMDRHWEENGYALDLHSEAPLCLMYRRFEAGAVPFKALADPYGGTFGFRPYDVTIVSSGLYLISIVTPDLNSRFSKDVFESLVAALTG